MHDTHHEIMFIIPVINRFMGAHVKVSGVAEHRTRSPLQDHNAIGYVVDYASG
jgi:hypothetical protein